MARTPIQRIRNFGIMAHIDAGKTTVSERILFYSGRTYKMAEVHDGDATMDWMEQERERGITITSAVSSFEWRKHELHLIDTPGHVDFTVEVERSLRVLDGVVALYDAVSGVEPQSETVWAQAEKYKVPRLAFANKMDRPGANFESCVEQVRKVLRANPIPVQMPMGSASEFAGVIDLIEMKALAFSDSDQGHTVELSEIPAQFRSQTEEARERMIEQVADLDDDIASLYLEGAEIDSALIKAALRKATVENKAVPFFCGSGLRNKGVQPLLDAVVDYLPSPDEVGPLTGVDPKGHPLSWERSPKAHFSALVFKVQHIDGQKYIYLRMYSGKLSEGDNVLNSTKSQTTRIKNLFRMHANRAERISEAFAGDMIALTRTRNFGSGDTLCDPQHPIVLERIEARAPVVSISIEPESIRDKDKLTEALAALTDEDPTLKVEEDPETGEMVMRGMGELHLDIVCDRLQREFGAAVRRGKPSVVRRETCTTEATGRGVFARDTDEGSIFGDVGVKVRPNARGTGRTWAAALPSTHAYVKPDIVNAVLLGVQDALAFGPLSGEEVADVHADVVSIGCDPKGNVSLLGARIAAGEAVRNALKDAGPVILEPIMELDVVVAEEHIGDIISDLTLRNGTIESVESGELRTVIKALVPLRTMFGYTMKLRSMTKGRGVFTMEFRAFDQV
ncbi:MAG: elongation factor G [Myxococcota bacterium]|jgi:elongation factor G|nr:elongation factor G [Myxococcota bacterium]